MSIRRIVGVLPALLVLLCCSLTLPGLAWADADPSAAPTACTDGTQASGATYRICLPATWNGKLLVYAHGYVAPNRPLGIPEDQMALPGMTLTIDQIVTAQGYAFASSGYSTNGLAVQQGLADLIDVVAIFTAQQGAPQQILLAGVSEGGLIAALGVERHPDLFAGALALCGPVGDFRQQIDYFGDFRTLFDHFFPGLLPPSPVDVPASLLEGWETSYYSQTVQPVLVDPANAAALDQLLVVSGAAFDLADAASKTQTVEDVLWYNVMATNDARAKLGGQPFDNQGRAYQGSTDDQALNTAVQRFNADQAALDAIAASYQTTGRLGVPLITMHTTGDPVVPYAQAITYSFKTMAADNIALHEHLRVERYGHCQFTALEVLGAFNRLQTLVDNPPAYRAVQRSFLPLVAEP